MKFQLRLLIIILLSFAANIAGQDKARHSEPALLNAAEYLTDIAAEVRQIEGKYNSSPKGVVQHLDIVCSKDIIDTSSSKFDILIDATEKIALPDDQLAVFSSISNDYLLEISFNELSFRILNAIQKHLESVYISLSSGDKMMNIPVFATANLEISQKKTRLMRRQVWILSSCEKKEEKFRCWLAVKRMLDEIDIPKSESGDQVVQRSPYGIIVQPGEVMPKLKIISENEADEQIRMYSDGLIKLLDSSKTKYIEYKTEIALNELGNYKPENRLINPNALSFFEKALSTKDNKEKIVLYTSAIKVDSNFTAAYNNRAACFFENENFEDATNDFNKVLSLDKGYTSVYKFLGTCSYKTGRFEQAANYFTEALKYDISDTLFISRGMCYQRSGQYSKAVPDFSFAIKFNSKSKNAYINRVQCLLALKQYSEAAKDYQKLIILDPKNSTYYYNLGCIYSIQKDWNKVIEIWNKGLSINPEDKNILLNLPKAKSNLSLQKGNK